MLVGFLLSYGCCFAAKHIGLYRNMLTLYNAVIKCVRVSKQRLILERKTVTLHICKHKTQNKTTDIYEHALSSFVGAVDWLACVPIGSLYICSLINDNICVQHMEFVCPYVRLNVSCCNNVCLYMFRCAYNKLLCPRSSTMQRLFTCLLAYLSVYVSVLCRARIYGCCFFCLFNIML